ncbi:MAG: hypothetical protein K2Q20_15515 [Phycisphaerales bacterium]|nr:hypothetical protein [Phycisphaerales bacterium]
MGGPQTFRRPGACLACVLSTCSLQACAPVIASPLGIGIGAFGTESTPDRARLTGVGIAITPGRLTFGWLDASITIDHDRPAPVAPGVAAVGE